MPRAIGVPAKHTKSLTENSKTDWRGGHIAFCWLATDQEKSGVDQLHSIQDWIDNLPPMLAFLLMSCIFLAASTAGWYAANAASIRSGRQGRR